MAVGKRSGNPVVRLELDPKSLRRLRAALAILDDDEKGPIHEAMHRIGLRLSDEVRSRAPGSMGSKVEFLGVRHQGTTLRAAGLLDHPGAKSMEFGRSWWYDQMKGNNRPGSKRQKGARGHKFPSSPGQPERPFVGIKNLDHAIAAVHPYAVEQINTSVTEAWEKVQ